MKAVSELRKNFDGISMAKINEFMDANIGVPLLLLLLQLQSSKGTNMILDSLNSSNFSLVLENHRIKLFTTC